MTTTLDSGSHVVVAPAPRSIFGMLIDGRYEPVEELGRGGMGMVLRARDLQLEREVALKVMTRTTPTAVERFRREGLIAQGLSHPNIVRVLNTGTNREHPYIAYELVPGAHTLLEVFDHADLRRRVELVRDAALALGYAHLQGVVHRDVKPENVLVDLTGRVRVTDFGLASARGLTRITREGKVLGTPVAMSPEQVRGKPSTPATDVWALGVILYHALTERPPFEAESMPDLAHMIVQARPERPRAHDPFIPRELEAICLRALAPRERDRYATGSDLARDLDRALAGRLSPLRSAYLRARASAKAWLPWAAVAGLGFGLGVLVGALS
jgi:serine/threonine protein kinase